MICVTWLQWIRIDKRVHLVKIEKLVKFICWEAFVTFLLTLVFYSKKTDTLSDRNFTTAYNWSERYSRDHFETLLIIFIRSTPCTLSLFPVNPTDVFSRTVATSLLENYWTTYCEAVLLVFVFTNFIWNAANLKLYWVSLIMKSVCRLDFFPEATIQAEFPNKFVLSVISLSFIQTGGQIQGHQKSFPVILIYISLSNYFIWPFLVFYNRRRSRCPFAKHRY